jgi:hypothetical protein
MGARKIWSQFQQQKALWRENWPAVLRELGDGDARVIGSITEEPALMLLANRDKSLSELTKPLPEGASGLITSELQGLFGEYAASLRLPGEDGSAFFAAGQKLTALKMQREGVSEGVAAAWTYDQLVGSRYAFDGVTRIPKAHEDVADRLENAKLSALKSADLSSLPAGVDREDAEAWSAGSVQWVTLPDDSGVILMEGARPMRDAQGRAIMRNWSDIRSAPMGADVPSIPIEMRSAP